MTKYIIHGGATSIKNESNNKFHAECLAGYGQFVKFLLVCYSQLEENWQTCLAQDKEKLSKAEPEKIIEFEIASKDREEFIQQIKRNDIIFLRGGFTEMLFAGLQGLENRVDLFEEKTVVGTSAGAYWLSKYYSSRSSNKIKHGSGVLNIKVACHYTDEYKNKVEDLKHYKEDLPVYVLADSEFAVIVK